ncbi:hypothetical protein C8F04DRAFT_654418 [Mycena alexandri]|uniref:Transmembrane protein n=1 Tax=Mycena alexandri TaxID=1745969 RepID=A0AAD6SR70_9AGAR|nr:hypothetical protein C8F04DRAFT_654418 [Mycena alexandri]
MPFPLPSLEYPITRTYPGRVFAPAAMGGALVVVVFLTVINVALAGYDTVPGFDSNFNVTQTHWYDRFLPSVALTKPGTLCDPRLLGLGDTITTNNSLFQYTIASIDVPNAGDSGFSYQGWTLDNCDVTSLYINSDELTFMDFTALVSCRADAAQIARGNNFEITARADWSESELPGKYGLLLGIQKAQKAGFNKTADAPGSVLNAITSVSSADWSRRIGDLVSFTNGSFLSVISLAAAFPWCPASLGPDAPCASKIPPLNVTNMFQYSPVTQQGAIFDLGERDNTPLIDSDTVGIISNVVQVVYAAVRLDLGNRNPANNFLLNTSLIPLAIAQAFPRNTSAMPTESFLYSVLVNDSYYSTTVNPSWDIPGLLPLALPGPAVLDGVYLCRFQRAKSPGAGFIAVLVATLSMFMAAWGQFLGLAEGVVKRRRPEANMCECHTLMERPQPLSPSAESAEKEPFVN